MAKRFKRDWFTNELVEEEYVPDTGRRIIFRETPTLGERVGRATNTNKTHVSKALACHPKQAARFNKDLDTYGVTGARYSNKTGFLESGDRESKAAAWAVRGCFDQEAGNIEQRYASAIGF